MEIISFLLLSVSVYYTYCSIKDLMMDDPNQNALIVISDNILKELEGDSFIDELTLKEVYFDDLIKIEVK